MTRTETLTRTPGGEPIETPELTRDFDEAIRLLRTAGLRFTVNAWMILASAVGDRMWMTPAEVIEHMAGCTACGAPGPLTLYRSDGRLVCGPCLDAYMTALYPTARPARRRPHEGDLTMTTTEPRPDVDYGTAWVDRATHGIVATVNDMRADGTVELMTSGDPFLVALTIDELHAAWESATVLTPIGSKWTTDLLYMPSIVTEVNHATGECHRHAVGDPEDETWDECWKVHKYMRQIGGPRARA